MDLSKTGNDTELSAEFTEGIDPRMMQGRMGTKRLKFDVHPDSAMWGNCTLRTQLKRSVRSIVRSLPDLSFTRDINIMIIPHFQNRAFRSEIQARFHSIEELRKLKGREKVNEEMQRM